MAEADLVARPDVVVVKLATREEVVGLLVEWAPGSVVVGSPMLVENRGSDGEMLVLNRYSSMSSEPAVTFNPTHVVSVMTASEPVRAYYLTSIAFAEHSIERFEKSVLAANEVLTSWLDEQNAGPTEEAPPAKKSRGQQLVDTGLALAILERFQPGTASN